MASWFWVALLSVSTLAAQTPGNAPSPTGTSEANVGQSGGADAPSSRNALDAQFGPGSRIPWKSISKTTACAAYAAWSGLWTASVPAFVSGASLMAISAAPNFSAQSTALLTGGALLVAVSAIAILGGTLSAVLGTGFGVSATLLQMMYPDAKADQSNLSLILPRSVLL
jgi:hypothetical protein